MCWKTKEYRYLWTATRIGKAEQRSKYVPRQGKSSEFRWPQWQHRGQLTQSKLKSSSQFFYKIPFLWSLGKSSSPPPQWGPHILRAEWPQWKGLGSRCIKKRSKKSFSTCKSGSLEGTGGLQSYRSNMNLGVHSEQWIITNLHDGNEGYMKYWIIDHPSEGFCQNSKELVNIQDSTHLEPIKRRNRQKSKSHSKVQNSKQTRK